MQPCIIPDDDGYQSPSEIGEKLIEKDDEVKKSFIQKSMAISVALGKKIDEMQDEIKQSAQDRYSNKHMNSDDVATP